MAKLLASGHGIFSLLDTCYKNKWTKQNSRVEISNTNDLNSKWRIYEL